MLWGRAADKWVKAEIQTFSGVGTAHWGGSLTPGTAHVPAPCSAERGCWCPGLCTLTAAPVPVWLTAPRCLSCKDRPWRWPPSALCWGSLASRWHPLPRSWRLSAPSLWGRVQLQAWSSCWGECLSLHRFPGDPRDLVLTPPQATQGVTCLLWQRSPCSELCAVLGWLLCSTLTRTGHRPQNDPWHCEY